MKEKEITPVLISVDELELIKTFMLSKID